MASGPNVLVAITGLANSGKTTFAHVVATDNIQVGRAEDGAGDSLKVSDGVAIKLYKVPTFSLPGGGTITVVDTNPFAINSIGGVSSEYFSFFINWIQSIDSIETWIHGIIFLIPVHREVTDVEALQISIFRKMIGPQFARNIVFVTTHWEDRGKDEAGRDRWSDETYRRTWTRRCKENENRIKEQHLASMISSGAHFVPFQGNDRMEYFKSAEAAIGLALRSPIPTGLKIHDEIVDEHKKLAVTLAGKGLYDHYARRAQKWTNFIENAERDGGKVHKSQHDELEKCRAIMASLMDSTDDHVEKMRQAWNQIFDGFHESDEGYRKIEVRGIGKE